jgi:hypothetical protein
MASHMAVINILSIPSVYISTFTNLTRTLPIKLQILTKIGYQFLQFKIIINVGSYRYK